MKEQENENIEFDEKSAETIYNEIVRQYNLEMDAHDTLKDKANSIIAINGTIITLVTLAAIQILGLDVLYWIKYSIILFSIPYFFFIRSFLSAIDSYLLVDLETINASGLLENYYRRPKLEILDQLSSNLAENTDKNKLNSRERKKYMDKSMLSLRIGVISLVLVLISIFALILLK